MLSLKARAFYEKERELARQPLFGFLNKNVLVVCRSGDEFYGKLKLIGQYEILLENDGKKLIIFKHAIEYIAEVD